MKNKIIERFTASKTGIAADNEDGIFVSDRYLAVVDGATSKESGEEPKAHNGKIIKDTILRAIESLSGTETAKEAFEVIRQFVLADSPEEKIGKACASVLLYSQNKKEIWSLGDCQLLLGGRFYSQQKEVDRVLSETRALALECFLRQGDSLESLALHDKGRDMILPFLKMQKNLENQNGVYGFTVLNNDPAVCDLEKAIRVYPVEPGTEIVMASDGYPFLRATLSESEKELEELLRNDPLCFRIYKSTKGLTPGNASYDDRTYLRFRA